MSKGNKLALGKKTFICVLTVGLLEYSVESWTEELSSVTERRVGSRNYPRLQNGRWCPSLCTVVSACVVRSGHGADATIGGSKRMGLLPIE